MSADIDSSPSAQTRNFPCEACGGTLVYAAGTTHLQCPHCGHKNPIATGRAEAREHDLSELDLRPAAEAFGFGIETRNFKCSQCSATTSLPPGVVSTKCSFCASEAVVQTPSNPRMIRPETIIPFRLDGKSAAQKFRGWLGRLWFRPSNLKKMAALSDIAGIYTPFFTFDAQANSEWTGEAGTYYYESESYYDSHSKEYKTRQARKVRWQRRSGRHSAFYNDELICASRGMAWKLIRRIYPFRLEDLVPYKEEFLAGWSAEEYSIDPRDSWRIAQETMNSKEESACSEMLGGDTQRNLSVTSVYSRITWKHLLLPVYVSAYRYGGKVYRFMVNGDTGEVSGEAPASLWKIAGLILLLAIAAGIIYLTARSL